jgi:hypothetical protein
LELRQLLVNADATAVCDIVKMVCATEKMFLVAPTMI